MAQFQGVVNIEGRARAINVDDADASLVVGHCKRFLRACVSELTLILPEVKVRTPWLSVDVLVLPFLSMPRKRESIMALTVPPLKSRVPVAPLEELPPVALSPMARNETRPVALPGAPAKYAVGFWLVNAGLNLTVTAAAR